MSVLLSRGAFLESDVASAATCDIGATSTLKVRVTGTATVTSFGTSANRVRIGRFAGVLTLTHNATSLILPGGANIATAAGDTFWAVSDPSGNWRVIVYLKASGKAIVAPAAGDISDISANGASLVTAANYAAMKALLDLQSGIDFYSIAAANAAFLALAGGTMTGALTIQPAAGTNVFTVAANALSHILSSRASADGGAARFEGRKSRGTLSSPAVVVNGDDIFSLRAVGYDGSNHVDVGNVLFSMAETTPGVGAMGSMVRIFINAVGASGAAGEIFRGEMASGWSMGGANVVVDQNRLHRLRVYTVATLPTAGIAGRMAMVSDATAPTYNGALTGGGAVSVPVFDNGAAWRS